MQNAGRFRLLLYALPLILISSQVRIHAQDETVIRQFRLYAHDLTGQVSLTPSLASEDDRNPGR